MRARAGLAECLWAAGERAAAIGHYRDMLRLNPNDNQGLRHVLTSWLLATGDHGALEELLAAYDDDVFAEWAYAKTLLALRKGDEADARTALAAAWKRNPHVPALLTAGSVFSESVDGWMGSGFAESLRSGSPKYGAGCGVFMQCPCDGGESCY